MRCELEGDLSGLSVSRSGDLPPWRGFLTFAARRFPCDFLENLVDGWRPSSDEWSEDNSSYGCEVLPPSLLLLFLSFGFAFACCEVDFPSLTSGSVTRMSVGLFSPFNTSVAVRLLSLGATVDSGALSRARKMWARAETLFAKESHSECKLETNSSTKACSLLLMSSMGGLEDGSLVEEILDAGEASDRRDRALPLLPCSACCTTHVQDTIECRFLTIIKWKMWKWCTWITQLIWGY